MRHMPRRRRGLPRGPAEAGPHVVLLSTLGVLALLAVPPAAQAAPAIALSPRVITEGQTVTVRATGFTPNGHVLAHLVRPDGTEYPEMSFTADATGEVSHLITIILILTGTYEVQMIDLASKTVGVSRFMVVEGSLPPAAPAGEGVPPSIAGVWQGPVSRADPPQSRTVLVSLLPGGGIGSAVGTVAYPGAGCGGELWLLGASGDSAQLGEHITYGEDRCSDGVVTVRPSRDGALEIQRRDAGRMDVAPASGTLPRRM